MAQVHEDHALDRLDKDDPAGWVDLFAAITAWGKSGRNDKAIKLITCGHKFAARLTEGSENVRQQLQELTDWLGEKEHSQ